MGDGAVGRAEKTLRVVRSAIPHIVLPLRGGLETTGFLFSTSVPAAVSVVTAGKRLLLNARIVEGHVQDEEGYLLAFYLLGVIGRHPTYVAEPHHTSGDVGAGQEVVPLLERIDADAVLFGQYRECVHQSPIDDPSLEVARRLRRRPEVGGL